MRRHRRAMKLKAILTVSLALAVYAPRSAAQEPATATATAWIICGSPAGPVLFLGTCAATAGVCVGYGMYKIAEWCIPDPPPIGPSVFPPAILPGPTVGPAPGPTVGPAPGPGQTPPPPPPVTKEGCIFLHSICTDDAEAWWDIQYDMCTAMFPIVSPEWDSCMDAADESRENRKQKCDDDLADCLKRVGAS